jgi:hypothetical protein
LPYLPRVQKEDVAKTYTSSGADYTKRGQPYFPLEPTHTIIILKPTFLPKLQPPPRIPTQVPQISFAILPTIQLHTPRKPNSHTSTNNILSSTTPTNNIPHRKLANIPAPPTNQDSQQAMNFPTFRTIHTITGGSNLTFENKRQKREHYCQVNHVAVEGPILCTKWLLVPITFSKANVNLTSYPHTYAMDITTHVDKWNVTRVLVVNGSQA